jgi:hypothetical protein
MGKQLKINIGDKINKLTILSKVSLISGSMKNRMAFNCLCECGKEKIFRYANICSGRVKSCGCSKKEYFSRGSLKILINERFGRLITVSYSKRSKNRKDNNSWLCLCDCGNYTNVDQGNLIKGNVKSCGCYGKEESKKRIHLAIEARQYKDPKRATANIKFIKTYKDGDLSLDEFILLCEQNCHYCNSEPNNITIKYKKKDGVNFRDDENKWIYNGLDRVDSSLPHYKNNVKTCCFQCNVAKSNYSLDLFRSNILRLNPKELNFTYIKDNNYKIENIRYTSYVSAMSITYVESYKDGNIKLNDFYKLSQMNCYYCNLPPSNLRKIKSLKSKDYPEKFKQFIYSGLDRVDSNKRHDIDNVVPCCKYCNFSKNIYSYDEFMNWTRRIKEHQLKTNW